MIIDVHGSLIVDILRDRQPLGVCHRSEVRNDNASLSVANRPVIFAWWRRNIYLGMIVHCLGNTVGALVPLASAWDTNSM